MARAGGPQEASTLAPAAAGTRRVRTSFGTLEVHRPNLVHGTGPRDLAGNVHGIGDYVPPHRQLVQVPVTLSNESAATVRFGPSRFQLASRQPRASADAVVSEAASASLGTGRLDPGTKVDGVVTFVVPRDGARLDLRFEDTEGLHLRVPLGTAGPALRRTPADHMHHEAGAHAAARHDHEHDR